MKTPPAMLTVDQVAAILQISPRTVYRLAAARKFPRPVKLGTHSRWPRASIDAWILAQLTAHCRRLVIC